MCETHLITIPFSKPISICASLFLGSSNSSSFTCPYGHALTPVASKCRRTVSKMPISSFHIIAHCHEIIHFFASTAGQVNNPRRHALPNPIISFDVPVLKYLPPAVQCSTVTHTHCNDRDSDWLTGCGDETAETIFNRRLMGFPERREGGAEEEDVTRHAGENCSSFFGVANTNSK